MDQEHLVIERFGYRSVHGRVAECRIEAITLVDGRVVVIATELVDNSGMSITNAAEYVATDVCEALGIEPHQLVWIEYYGYPVPGDSDRKRTYDLVTFTSTTPGRRPIFHQPHWRPMKDNDWKALGISTPPTVF